MKKNILPLMAMIVIMAMSVGEIQAQVIKAPKKTTAAAPAKKKTTAKPVRPNPATVFKLNGNENDFSLSVEPSGGLVEMNVITNAPTYSIDQMPTFCKLQSQMGGTFVIKCEPNNTNQDRSGILIVSVPEGKKIIVSLQQKGYETSFLYTLYGITLGRTTFQDLLARGFQRKNSYITADKWKGTYSIACYKSSNDASETINKILVQWMWDTLPFPQEWRDAGAPSGNTNYYTWIVFLQHNGFTITEKEEVNSVNTDLADKTLTAVNKKIGLIIDVE